MRRHHDAIEFPDGSNVLVTLLVKGQRAIVLQLPVVHQVSERTQKLRNTEAHRHQQLDLALELPAESLRRALRNALSRRELGPATVENTRGRLRNLQTTALRREPACCLP